MGFTKGFVMELLGSFRKWFAAHWSIRQAGRRRLTRPLLVESLEDRWMPATLDVGTGLHDYHTIQAAIDAARNGDTILVDPGTYQEQLTINKSIDIEARSGCDQWCHGNSAIILAPTNMGAPTTTDPGAIVHITGNGVCADISGFVIEGAPATNTTGAGDANLYYGVRVDGGANADINFNTITNIIDQSNPSFGVAISVGNASDSPDNLGSQVGSATVALNTISNYQRAGVVVSNTGSSAAIALNDIVGTSVNPAGSITGVEVSDGAVGLVSFNAISNNTNQSTGVGVLLYQPGKGTTVAANAIFGNDYGIYGDEVAASTNCGHEISFFCNAQFYEGGFGQVSLSGFNGFGVSYQPGQGFTAPDNAIFSHDCSFFGGTFGVCAGYGQGISISNNFITGNTFVGIEFDNSSHLLISGNFIADNGGATFNYEDAGIFLYQSTDNQIVGNTSIYNNGSGILLDAGSTGNSIQGNILFGNYYYNSVSYTLASADGVDLSAGNGTAGTANCWSDNFGVQSITLSGESLFDTRSHRFGFGFDF